MNMQILEDQHILLEIFYFLQCILEFFILKIRHIFKYILCFPLDFNQQELNSHFTLLVVYFHVLNYHFLIVFIIILILIFPPFL